MNNKILGLFRLASASFFIALSPVAFAQNSGTVTNHALPIGKGPGVAGYGSLLLGSGQLAIGQTSADPTANTLSGDVTMGATGVTAIGANKVTNAQLRQSGALALIGRSANTTGNVADIQATAGSSCVFMESASSLTCGAISTASIAANAVTFAKFQQIAALSMFGNCTNATANGAAVTGIANQVLRVNGAGTSCAFGAIDLSQAATATGVLQAASEPAHTGDVTNTAGSLALTIANNAVTNAKMAQGGAASVKMNATASTANETDSTIQGLTNLASPSATLDFLLCYDHVSGTLKSCTPGAIASSAVAGVSSLNGLTGVLSIAGGTGISATPSGSTVTIAAINTPILLNTLTASNSATLTDTTSLTSAFNNYKIIFRNVLPVTNAVDCRLRVQSGGSIQTASYLGTSMFTGGAGAGNGNQTTFIPCSGGIGRVINTAGYGISGEITLYGPASGATNVKTFVGTVGYNSGTTYDVASIAGMFGSSATVTGVQIDFSSGNISSGSIEIWGIP